MSNCESRNGRWHQLSQLFALAAGAAVVYAFSGTMEEWLLGEGLFVVLPVAVLAVLHPSRQELLRRPSFDGALVPLAGLAAIPWAIYMVDNSRMQLINAPSDSHAEAEHWAVAALLGVTILVCSLLASTDHRGWRLPAWIASAGSVIFGVHSLVFPDLASALTPLWAAAAIVWELCLPASSSRGPDSSHSTSDAWADTAYSRDRGGR